MATIQQKQQSNKTTGIGVVSVVIAMTILVSIAAMNSSSVVSGIIVAACLIIGLGVTAFLSLISRDNSRYEVKD